MQFSLHSFRYSEMPFKTDLKWSDHCWLCWKTKANSGWKFCTGAGRKTHDIAIKYYLSVSVNPILSRSGYILKYRIVQYNITHGHYYIKSSSINVKHRPSRDWIKMQIRNLKKTWEMLQSIDPQLHVFRYYIPARAPILLKLR